MMAQRYSRYRRMGWIGWGVVALLVAVALPGNARAQGSIFGTVQNANLTNPAVGTLFWVGFLDNTDEEIRIESNTGAGYDGTFWFDDFQNYSTEVAGNPYDYIFTNTVNGQYFRLEKFIPNNSFQEEDVILAAVAGLPRPTGLTARVASLARINLSWNFQAGATYHVYRRATANNSAFRRLDDPAGNLASIGVPDSFFVDATSDGASDYTYVIISQTAGGIFSAHSVEVSALASAPIAPSVSSVTPDSAGTSGGVPVTVRGANFDVAGASITFGGNAASNVVVVSPFVLTCTIPPGVAGFASVVVTNTGSGLASAPLVNGFHYVINGAPTANAGTDVVGVTVGSLVVLDGTGSSDPDLNPLHFHWLQVAGPAVTLSDSTIASPTFTPFVIATFRFRLLVDDGQLLSQPDTVMVQVVNQPPVLAPIGTLSITEGALLSVLITAS
ncbi:MAG: IPT/TIG domain-containing protein, partial [candidate division Zixibacteria bacterium]|nr:IPT/TIG domain-containing protein [candidate division Zixibacteria bacterium]